MKKFTLFNTKLLCLLTILLTLGGVNAWGQTHHGDEWYSLYDETEYSNPNVYNNEVPESVVPPTSGTISIDWKKDAIYLGTYFGKKTYTYPGFDLWVGGTNNSHKIAYSNATANEHTSYSTSNGSVGVDITSVSVYYHCTSTGYGHIKNIRIPMAKHIRLANNANGTTSITNVNLGSAVYGNTSSTVYHINLRSFYVGGTSIKYESNNPEFHFGAGSTFANGKASISKSVIANSCAAAGGTANCASTASQLGNPDNQEVDVYFTPGSNKNGSSTATVTIYDGTTARATITFTAKVEPTYYFKATTVATTGTNVINSIPVRASFTEGSYTAASATASMSNGVDKDHLSTTAYFYAPASCEGNQFEGWYADAACATERLSTENTISQTITANSVSSANPTETKYYAKYLESITAEFSGEGQEMKVGETYGGINYIRTSADEASASSGDNFWFEYVDNTPTGVTTGSSNASQIISYNPKTKVVTAHNAGTAKLILHQKAAGLYTAVDQEYTFTISKHTNAVKVNNTADYSANVYFNDGIQVAFSSLNTNNPTAAYTVEQNSGAEYATYYDNENGQYIWTAPTPGTAVWTVTQAEDYKFVSASTTMTVNVVAAPASTGCYVLNAPNEQTLTTHSYSTGGVQGEPMELSGPGATLTFKAMKSMASAFSGLYVQYSSDGTRWDDINAEVLHLNAYSYGNDEFSFDISNLDAKYIRFEAKVGATYTKRIKDVRVTRKTFLSPSTTDLRLDKNGEVFIYSNETASASFTINWSCASGGNLNLSTNNDKFRVEPTVIENVDCNGGSTPVTVYYDATSADEVEAKLYISNSVYSTTVNLTGSAMLHNQTINWTNGVEIMELGAEVTDPASAMTTVTYTSSNPSVISVSADGRTLTAVTRGTATITATAAASGVYAQATDSKTFTVTDDKPQYILWNQSLVNLHVGDENVVLTATTTSSVDGCTTNGLRPITYTSDNESVAKIVNGNELQIMGVGMATITASQAGGEDADGHNYVAVSKENKVVVTDPSVECVAYIPIETTSGTLFSANTNKPQVQLDIELNPAVNGKPASVSFDTKTEKFAGIWLSGNLILAQKLNGIWVDVRNFGLPTEGSYDTYTDIELDPAATAIRFYRPKDGEGYFDIANISVKKARYIMASAEEYTITTKVGESKPQSITVNYSNVVGPITCSLSGSNPHFSINHDAVVAGCGDHGQVEIMVTYAPTAETNGETDVLTISDGQTTCTVDLTGQASLTTRTIVWSAPTTVYTLQTCTLAASCQTEYEMSAGEVKFRLLPSSTTGTLTNNVLSFDKAGVVNIEAYVEEDYRFTMPDPVSASIEVIQTPTEITTLPSISDITVGMALSQITLTGGEAQNTINNETVAGTISVIDGNLSAAGEQTITLQFTPDNTNRYASSTRDVTVTIVAGPFVYTGNGLWTEDDNWNRGTTPSGSDEVIINGKVTVSGDVTVNSLTITEGAEVTLIVDGHLTINGDSKDADNYGDLFVKNGGEVEVNGTLKVRDLTVEASIGTSDGSAMSGQIAKAHRIAYSNAYIEINMDPTGVMNDTKWYGFTVPFEVNAHTGVSRKDGKVYRDCSYGSDYIIAEYDAAKRLSSGKGWKYLVGNTLNAGQFYYFGANGTYNTYRFKAAESSYSAVTEKSLSMNGSGSDANWNAVGNSTLQHVKASYAGGSYVQVYQNGLEAYKTVPTSSTTFVVGCPFFIQASETSTLTLSEPMTKGATAYYAPRRSVADEENEAVCINFSSVDGGYSDPIYVSATDKEENTYILGRDLSKAGECKIVPQMWVNEYGKKLSVHEAAWQGNNAFCALGLYVPADGEYTLSAAQTEDNNTQIYLTMDNQPIWNLTQSEYTVALEKGTSNAYGLMMVKAPAITTGVEQTQTSDVQESKVMINGMLFILRNGEMFDAVGRKVK